MALIFPNPPFLEGGNSLNTDQVAVFYPDETSGNFLDLYETVTLAAQSGAPIDEIDLGGGDSVYVGQYLASGDMHLATTPAELRLDSSAGITIALYCIARDVASAANVHVADASWATADGSSPYSSYGIAYDWGGAFGLQSNDGSSYRKITSGTAVTEDALTVIVATINTTSGLADLYQNKVCVARATDWTGHIAYYTGTGPGLFGIGGNQNSARTANLEIIAVRVWGRVLTGGVTLGNTATDEISDLTDNFAEGLEGSEDIEPPTDPANLDYSRSSGGGILTFTFDESTDNVAMHPTAPYELWADDGGGFALVATGTGSPITYSPPDFDARDYKVRARDAQDNYSDYSNTLSDVVALLVRDEDGFRVLEQAAGSSTWHVATAGNDTTGDGSEMTPWATVAKAQSEASPGDWILLNRGDTFTAKISHDVTINGTSPLLPTVYGAYGTGARPIVDVDEAENAVFVFPDTSQNVAIESLFLTCSEKDISVNGGPIGVGTSGSSISHIYIQDVRISNVFQFVGVSGASEVSYFRCVMDRSYGGSHIAYSAGTSFLECIIRHGGYVPGEHDGGGTLRALYFDTEGNSESVLNDCIVAESGGGPVQMRAGGQIKRNLFLDNLGYALTVSSGDTTPGQDADIVSNVFLDSRGLVGTNWGVGIVFDFYNFDQGGGAGTGATGTASDNILTGRTRPMDFIAGALGVDHGSTGVVYDNNIVYNWWGSGSFDACAFGTSDTDCDDVTISNNDLQMPNGVFVFRGKNLTEDDGFTYTGNRYLSTSAASFHYDELTASVKSFTEWVATYAPGDDSTYETVTYTDPDRNMASYMNMVNGNSAYDPEDADDIHAARDEFMDGAIAQSKGAWDPDFRAISVINYIRAGFDKTLIEDPYAATPLTDYSLTCEAGVFTLAGQDATLKRYRLTCESGAFALAGQSAGLSYSGEDSGGVGRGRLRGRHRGRFL